MLIVLLLPPPSSLFVVFGSDFNDLALSRGDGVGFADDRGDVRLEAIVDEAAVVGAVADEAAAAAAAAAICCDRFSQQNCIQSMYTPQKLARVTPDARKSKSSSKLWLKIGSKSTK